jgi:hypothetical protein
MSDHKLLVSAPRRAWMERIMAVRTQAGDPTEKVVSGEHEAPAFQSSNSEVMSDFVLRAQCAMTEGRNKAIAELRALGLPVYTLDAAGKVVEELEDRPAP